MAGALAAGAEAEAEAEAEAAGAVWAKAAPANRVAIRVAAIFFMIEILYVLVYTVYFITSLLVLRVLLR